MAEIASLTSQVILRHSINIIYGERINKSFSEQINKAAGLFRDFIRFFTLDHQ